MGSAGEGIPVVGIDLGGTKVLAAVVDAANRILGRAKRSTPAKEGSQAILAAITGCVADAIADSGLSKGDIAAAGIGSPGPLDTERGIILNSANLAVRDFPLGPELQKFLGKPVLVRNDVRVGGYGEFRLGAGRGFTDMIAAFVGTGIGGCVIVGGKVLHGVTGNAGEIGHICLRTKGPRCGCGRRGCMEAYASRTAIVRRIKKAVRDGRSTSVQVADQGKGDRIKSKDLAAAFESGDSVVSKEIERAARYLGIGLGSLANVLGPQLLVIGGGVAIALGDRYLELVRTAARSQIMTDPEGRTRIELAALGDDSGILGAALMAREHFLTRQSDS